MGKRWPREKVARTGLYLAISYAANRRSVDLQSKDVACSWAEVNLGMAKVVLITGCSAGIGRLTAELFAARGWSVAATARRPEEISLDNVTPLRMDVTDEASIASAVASTVDRFGAIDVLVNNAGY